MQERAFDLGEPLAAFVPRQRLQAAWLRNNYDCFAAGRSLALLVNGYRFFCSYKYLFQNNMRPCAGSSWPSLKPNLR